MSKYFKFLMILFVLVLVGCNRPQVEPKILPSDTSSPAVDVNTETSEPEETDSAQIIDTAEPTTDETDPPPAEPTVDMTQVLIGDLIPIFPAGTEVTIHEIHMVDSLTGWAIAVADPETEHILITKDGGITWQDVTPPQPVVTSDGGFSNAEFGIWDADTAWVAYGGAEYVWATKNGGRSWEAAPLAFMTTYDGMFAVLDENHAWFFQFLEGGMQKVFTALNRTSDGGNSWELLLDPYSDASIQAFDKTGAAFITPEYGWLTRDFRGVDPFVRVNLTSDGGFTWDSLDIPTPPGLPDVFNVGVGALFDPYLTSPSQGSFRLFSRYFENDKMIDQVFLYKTNDSGANWDILDIPNGSLYYINDQILYSISRDIYRSDDSGATWQKVKSVNWDGQFSFVDQNTAWVVAYNDGVYALVKTTDGCNSFSEIKPELITSSATR